MVQLTEQCVVNSNDRSKGLEAMKTAKIILAALALSLSVIHMSEAASLSSAQSSYKFSLTNPQSIPNSGTNTSGKALLVQAWGQTNHGSAYAEFILRVDITVCGTMVSRDSSVGPRNWYGVHANGQAYVPHGCSYRVDYYTNSNSLTTRTTGQYLSLE